MAVTEKITCDVCGAQKGQANHWLLWRIQEIVPGRSGAVGGLQIAPWHPDLYHSFNHVCGESCASRLLSRSIEEWREVQEAAAASFAAASATPPGTVLH